MGARRYRISSLQQLVQGASSEDFRNLRSPTSTRTFQPCDLGAAHARRHDLVEVALKSAGTPLPRRTRTKPFRRIVQ